MKRYKFMRFKRVQLIVFTLLFLIIAVDYRMLNGEENINVKDITSRQVEPFKYPMTFIVKFSNIIYEKNEKNIKIPIFQGISGDVKYKDLIRYCIDKKYIDQDMWIHYIIKCKKGKIKQTLHECLKFYKSNILKDVDVDSFKNASLSSTEWTLAYDFTIDGVPGYLKLQFDPRDMDLEKEPEYNSVYEIVPEENVKVPNFTYTIIIGAKSTD